MVENCNDANRMIESWLVQRLGREVGIDVARLGSTTGFDALGLDSVDAMGLLGDLMDWLGVELPPTILGEYKDIGSLAAYLSRLAVQPPSHEPDWGR